MNFFLFETWSPSSVYDKFLILAWSWVVAHFWMVFFALIVRRWGADIIFRSVSCILMSSADRPAVSNRARTVKGRISQFILNPMSGKSLGKRKKNGILLRFVVWFSWGHFLVSNCRCWSWVVRTIIRVWPEQIGWLLIEWWRNWRVQNRKKLPWREVILRSPVSKSYVLPVEPHRYTKGIRHSRSSSTKIRKLMTTF